MKVGLILLWLTTLACTTLAQINISAKGTSGQNYIYEMMITVPGEMNGQGDGLDLTAWFTRDTMTYVVPGFYYGENEWRIRFSPPFTGSWKYQVEYRTLDRIERASGVFNCIPSDRKGYLTRHASNPFRLVYSDGSLFNGIGIGDCFRDLNGNGTPHDEWGFDGDFRPPGVEAAWSTDLTTYMQTYAASGFNLFRWSNNNCAFNLYDKISVEGNEYSRVAGIWGDSLAEELFKNNIRIWFTFFGFDPPFHDLVPGHHAQEEALKKYLRYIIARYGAYTDIWELYNEARSTDYWINFVSSSIRNLDPFKRLIGTSWERPELPTIDLNTPHWYQKESEAESDLVTRDQIISRKGWHKPILFGEQGNSEQNWDKFSAIRMRVRSWSAFFNEGILVFWNSSFAKDYHGGYASNIYLGPQERGYIRILQNFTQQVTADAEMTTLAWSDSTQVRGYWLKSKNNYWAYFHHYKDHNSQTQVKFIFNATQRVTAKWYDPDNGNILASYTYEPGMRQLTSPDFMVDAALIIQPAEPLTATKIPTEIKLKVYPQPAENYLNLEIDPYPAVLTIKNLLGQTVYSGQLDNPTNYLPLSLPRGCYELILGIHRQFTVKKLIIN